MNTIRLKYQQDTGIQINKHIPVYPAELHEYIEWLEDHHILKFDKAVIKGEDLVRLISKYQK